MCSHDGTTGLDTYVHVQKRELKDVSPEKHEGQDRRGLAQLHCFDHLKCSKHVMCEVAKAGFKSSHSRC